MKKAILISLFLLFTISDFACGMRNILYINITNDNRILLQYEWVELDKVKDYVKQWVSNPKDSYDYPERKMREIPYFGNYPVSKGIISVQTDRSTTYGFYLKVNNEIEKAYNELRNELSLKKFGKPYNSLPKDKQLAVDKAYPKIISEAEPKSNNYYSCLF